MKCSCNENLFNTTINTSIIVCLVNRNIKCYNKVKLRSLKIDINIGWCVVEWLILFT